MTENLRSISTNDLFNRLELLAGGEKEVSFSTLDLCGEFLTGSNGSVILESLRGKSFEEAEKVRALLRPEGDPRDKIELVVIKPKMQSRFSFGTPDETDQKFRIGTNDVDRQKCRISFTASSEFAEDLERAKELNFRGASEDLLLETILGKALKLYLEKHCPKKRLERRQKMLAKREAVREQLARRAIPKSNSRYIPIALRDEVMKRDNYECAFEYQGEKCLQELIPF